MVANAYIGPMVRRYIGEIDDHIRSDGLFVPDRAVDRRLVRGGSGQGSLRAHAGIGPGGRRHRRAGAVPQLGLKNAIAFDMGGTTAKAGVIYQGEALTTGTR